jgi:hypothetical protein
MKARPFFIVPLLALGLVAACAAAPVVQGLQFNSVVFGGSATLQAGVTDSGGNLLSATFYVSGPATRDPANLNAITWPQYTSVGVVTLSGSSGSPQITWRPLQIGTYSVSVTVADQTSSTTQVGTFECVADRLSVGPVAPATVLTIASGIVTAYGDPGEILTAENDTTSNVVTQSGGSLIFWSGGRVDLKPGFHACAGSFFWAAVDHNMDGYSDVEQSTCTSGDGIPDAWKVDNGLSIAVNYSGQPQYLAAYQASVNGNGVVRALPSGSGQLVLRTPPNGNYAVDTTTWGISNL